MYDRIVLIGMPGTFKTSAGIIAARSMDYGFVDTDALFEDRNGSIREFITRYGEPLFRIHEANIIRHAAERTKALVATGGGVPLFPQNMNLLALDSLVIHLTADAQTIYERTKNSPRPLLPASLTEISKLLADRLPAYRRFEMCKIDTNGKTPEEVAREICVQTREFD